MQQRYEEKINQSRSLKCSACDEELPDCWDDGLCPDCKNTVISFTLKEILIKEEEEI